MNFFCPRLLMLVVLVIGLGTAQAKDVTIDALRTQKTAVGQALVMAGEQFQGLNREIVHLQQELRQHRVLLQQQDTALVHLDRANQEQIRSVRAAQGALLKDIGLAHRLEASELWLALLDHQSVRESRAQRSLIRHLSQQHQTRLQSLRDELHRLRLSKERIIAQKNARQNTQLALSKSLRRSQILREQQAGLLEDLQQKFTALEITILQKNAERTRHLPSALKQTLPPQPTPTASPKDVLLALLSEPQQATAPPKVGDLITPLSGAILAPEKAPLRFPFTEGVYLTGNHDEPVLSPYTGKVAYVGQQGGEGGLIIIIEHSGGYHSLLMNLANASIIEGQWVLGGEPIGQGTPLLSVQSHRFVYYELYHQDQRLRVTEWLP